MIEENTNMEIPSILYCGTHLAKWGTIRDKRIYSSHKLRFTQNLNVARYWADVHFNRNLDQFLWKGEQEVESINKGCVLQVQVQNANDWTGTTYSKTNTSYWLIHNASILPEHVSLLEVLQLYKRENQLVQL